MVKRILSLIMVLFLLTCNITVNSATNTEIARIYNNIKEQNPDITAKMYKSALAHEENGINPAMLEERLKKLIGDILYQAELEKNNWTLTEANLEQRLMQITRTKAFELEPVYLSVMAQSLSGSGGFLDVILSGGIPTQFQGLYNSLLQETKYILGFDDAPVRGSIFLDMENCKWADEAVKVLYDKGIVNGVTSDYFEPFSNVTREQFAKMSACCFEIVPDESNKVSFSDVKETDWFYTYIDALASNRLVNGIGNDMFGTGYNITRQDMAVMIYRIGQQKNAFSGGFNSADKFNDDSDIAIYAKDAVYTLKSCGIISGNENSMFLPYNFATRSESAVMMYNYLKYIKGV